jgi:hypothetical protein
VRDLIEQITRETSERHRTEGTRPLGTEKVKARHPRSRPVALAGLERDFPLIRPRQALRILKDKRHRHNRQASGNIRMSDVHVGLRANQRRTGRHDKG